MKITPPGMTTVGEARDDIEIMSADFRSALERDLSVHDVPADVMDAVLHRVDLAVDKVLQHFEARIAQKLVEH